MSNSDLINELISKEFEQQYFEECKHIWQNYVPLRQKKSYAPYRAKILFVQSLAVCDFPKREKNKSLRRYAKKQQKG